MTGKRYQRLDLYLAEAGGDLRAAIEAAQFARVIHHEEPGDMAEERAIAGFVGRFAAGAETWESPRRSGAGGAAGPPER